MMSCNGVNTSQLGIVHIWRHVVVKVFLRLRRGVECNSSNCCSKLLCWPSKKQQFVCTGTFPESWLSIRDMRSIASRRNSTKCSFRSVRLRGLFPQTVHEGWPPQVLHKQTYSVETKTNGGPRAHCCFCRRCRLLSAVLAPNCNLSPTRAFPVGVSSKRIANASSLNLTGSSSCFYCPTNESNIYRKH